MKKYEDLTGLYSLSKTLRFELKPIGKTLENIEKKGLIEQDEIRAKEYEKVKDIIDDKYYNHLFDNMINPNRMETGWGTFPIQEKAEMKELLKVRMENEIKE